MKILLCTNQYDTTSNGPARFASLISQFGDQNIRVLSEDIATDSSGLYSLEIPLWVRKSKCSQFLRMVLYHTKAMAIRQNFPFDFLVYNHALVGIWSALWFKNTVGMINDDSYASFSFFNNPFENRWLKKMVFRQIEKLMYRICAKVIVNSDYLKLKLLTEYGKRDNVFRLYKGIPLPENFFISDQSLSPAQILFIKKDYKTGGLIDLIQALQVVSFEFNLHIVGPGTDDFPEIQGWLSKAKILDISTLHGYKEPSEIAALIKNASVFCVPSKREALGIANIEAMANGIPVVSTNVGGIPEVLDHGNNGWMANPGTPRQLAFMLDECMLKPALRKQKTVRGLIFVNQFSAAGMYHEFLSILSVNSK